MEKRPELQVIVAEHYVAGDSNEQIAHALNAADSSLNVHKDTILDYRRYPDVAVMIERLSKERIARLTRKIDSKLAARLDSDDEIDTETLLKIRKELLGGARKIEISTPADGKKSATSKLWDAADADPEAAARMMAATADDE
jgi:hypothetical protein